MYSANKITLEELLYRFTYNPTTGLFTYNYSFYGCRKDSIAGTKNARGYLIITINQKKEYLHRLAILYTFGKYPEEGLIVDHINGVKTDNRIVNLRVTSQQQNTHNSKLRSDNTSGSKGVSFDKSMQLYEVYINVNGIKKHIDYFKSLEEAAKVSQNIQQLHDRTLPSIF